MSKDEEKPRLAKLVDGADNLSLGVSIVVAVLLGVGAGLLMKDMFGHDWLLWVGVFWGVSAAILNVYKAYKKQVESYAEFKDDVRYKKYEYKDEDEDDE
ncbi:AtpZ/AtpI family protein [Sulfurospirillum arcachonense]|uniref:AtpZ/AtpI family protein n=1 Tax=Sulfurospirillum arcachonense TaxID=57666 RepID=UPI00046AD77F|nr:AtpZ/AtpI family protein [Sulfurospirillum arcachonense]